MKIKLFLFLLPIFGLFIMASCSLESEEDEVTYVQDQAGNAIDISGVIVTDYTGEIDTYVLENFPSTPISFVKLRSIDKDYLVELSNARLFLFNTNGSFNQELTLVL